jgi:hypothetical protein
MCAVKKGGAKAGFGHELFTAAIYKVGAVRSRQCLG